MTHAGRRGVKALRWSADGNETPRNFLLASGDATGLVAFWTVDRRARPEKIAELSPERAFSSGEFLSAKAAGESGAFRVTHLLAAPFDAKTDADGEKNSSSSGSSCIWLGLGLGLGLELGLGLGWGEPRVRGSGQGPRVRSHAERSRWHVPVAARHPPWGRGEVC